MAPYRVHNEAFAADIRPKYDVLVLYDLSTDIAAAFSERGDDVLVNQLECTKIVGVANAGPRCSGRREILLQTHRDLVQTICGVHEFGKGTTSDRPPIPRPVPAFLLL